MASLRTNIVRKGSHRGAAYYQLPLHSAGSQPLVKSASSIGDAQERFGTILNRVTSTNSNRSKIFYDRKHDIEVGEGWNQGDSLMNASCGGFMRRQGAGLAVSFEFPYFGTEQQVVTIESCRQFGADFAQAIESYVFDV